MSHADSGKWGRELGQKKELREEVHSMQRILRILLLTCCVLGYTTGIQPALELYWILGQSSLSTNSAALLPWEDSAPQMLLLHLCCQKSWVVELLLGMSGMPIACIQISCGWVIWAFFLPVLYGWCAALLILPLYPNPLLHFVMQCDKAQSSGFTQSRREKGLEFFFQAVHNRTVALSTPALWVGGMGAAMGGQWREQTDIHWALQA